MFKLCSASFLSSKTLNPFTKIPKIASPITKLESISIGLKNLLIASIAKKIAITINVKPLKKAAIISALLYPKVFLLDCDFFLAKILAI